MNYISLFSSAGVGCFGFKQNGFECIATVSMISDDEMIADIIREHAEDVELPCEIVLYQSLPKADKMEYIIQKCVELGAARIVPVETSRCIVKLDEKNKLKKVERWQKIASGAAEQSQRSIIPKIDRVMSWKEALSDAEVLRERVIPYEHKSGAEELKMLLRHAGELKTGSIGIFIGPEGGFTELEIEEASASGVQPITLGHRILRTETAGMALISAIMLEIESNM